VPKKLRKVKEPKIIPKVKSIADLILVLIVICATIGLSFLISWQSKTNQKNAQAQSSQRYIFGLHEAGGEYLMTNKNKPGWVLFTEEIGSNPNNFSSKNFQSFANQNLGVMVRLNNGYDPNGTLPCESEYDNFAKRVANYVQNSQGAKIWIIGNETNLRSEWPTCGGVVQPITTSRLANVFQKVRSQIKSLTGRQNDQVIPGAVSPWPEDTNQFPTGVDYHNDLLNKLGPGGVDAIALHSYAYPGSGSSPQTVSSEEKLTLNGKTIYKNYRVYRDLLSNSPSWTKSLPVYLTESAPLDGWPSNNNGWIQESYREINSWNTTPGTQKICAVITYRWPNWDANFGMQQRPQTIQDFNTALDQNYTCPGGVSDTLLINSNSVAFNPGKLFPKQYRNSDLVLSINSDSRFLAGGLSAVCQFKIKNFGAPDNDLLTGYPITSSKLSGQGVYNSVSNSYEVPFNSANGCRTTMLAALQNQPKWEFEIKVVRSDGQIFGTPEAYFMLYGALGIVSIGS